MDVKGSRKKRSMSSKVVADNQWLSLHLVLVDDLFFKEEHFGDEQPYKFIVADSGYVLTAFGLPGFPHPQSFCSTSHLRWSHTTVGDDPYGSATCSVSCSSDVDLAVHMFMGLGHEVIQNCCVDGRDEGSPIRCSGSRWEKWDAHPRAELSAGDNVLSTGGALEVICTEPR